MRKTPLTGDLLSFSVNSKVIFHSKPLIHSVDAVELPNEPVWGHAGERDTLISALLEMQGRVIKARRISSSDASTGRKLEYDAFDALCINGSGQPILKNPSTKD